MLFISYESILLDLFPYIPRTISMLQLNGSKCIAIVFIYQYKKIHTVVFLFLETDGILVELKTSSLEFFESEYPFYNKSMAKHSHLTHLNLKRLLFLTIRPRICNLFSENLRYPLGR